MEKARGIDSLLSQVAIHHLVNEIFPSSHLQMHDFGFGIDDTFKNKLNSLSHRSLIAHQSLSLQIQSIKEEK